MSVLDMIYYASIGKKGKVLHQLNCGVDVNAMNSNQETALFHAAKNGRLSTVKALLKHGADPNVLSLDGFTPVIISSIQGQELSLRVLLQAGGTWFTKEDVQLKMMCDAVFRHENYEHKNNNMTAKIPLRNNNSKVFEIEGMFKIQECFMDGTKMAAKSRKFAISECNRISNIVENEFNILSSLRHVNILQPFLKAEFERCIVLLTEEIELGNLYQMIHTEKRKIKPNIRNEILYQIIQGCLFLHREGIVHNFINSTSVYISNAKNWNVKLGNLEYAFSQVQKILAEDKKFHLKYMSPELIASNLKDTSIFSDVYSFGCLAWEIISLAIPWSWIENEDIIILANDRSESVCLPMQPCWPHYFRLIIQRCTQRKIEDRPPFEKISNFFRQSCQGILNRKNELEHTSYVPLPSSAPLCSLESLDNNLRNGSHMSSNNISRMLSDFNKGSNKGNTTMITSSLCIRHANNCICQRSQQQQQHYESSNVSEHVINPHYTSLRPEASASQQVTQPSTHLSNPQEGADGVNDLLDELDRILVNLFSRGETDESVKYEVDRAYKQYDKKKRNQMINQGIQGASTIAFNEIEEKDKVKQQQLVNEIYAVVGKPKKKDWAKRKSVSDDDCENALEFPKEYIPF